MTDITQVWHWQQWFIATSMLINLIAATAMHGKPRGDYNGFAGMVSFALSAFILGTAGFFS